MWLINTTTLQLEEFYPSKAPPYAILSHTWGKDEVTFHDITSASASFTTKKGYNKITQTCRLAREQNPCLDYAWIDTCCIDKSSSAELTESINSMFEWYQNSQVCFAILEDLRPGATDSLGGCRWFKRGWTLQELLAPSRVDFYDMTWTFFGSKDPGQAGNLVDKLFEITKIPVDVITGKHPVWRYPVGSRMAWSAGRETTREEDRAYSLLGIFGIAMPLVYGEGARAFRRLQEEIIKRYNDRTIFAWERVFVGPIRKFITPPIFVGPFANSPDEFANASKIYHLESFEYVPSEFSVTNRGVVMSANPLVQQISWEAEGESHAGLGLHVGSVDWEDEVDGTISNAHAVVIVQKVAPGLFYRDIRMPLILLTPRSRYKAGALEPLSAICLLELKDTVHIYYLLYDSYRQNTVRLPFSMHSASGAQTMSDLKVRLQEVTPFSLWDPADGLFVQRSPTAESYRFIPTMAMCMSFEIQGPGIDDFTVFVLCDLQPPHGPRFRLFRWSEFREEAELLFAEENRVEFFSQLELRRRVPRLFGHEMGSFLKISTGGKELLITASSQSKNHIGQTGMDIPVFELSFKVERYSLEVGSS